MIRTAEDSTNGHDIQWPGPDLQMLLDNIEAYGRIKFELVKLKTLQAATRTSSALVYRLIIYALTFLCIVLASMGIAFLLGNVLGGIHLGFLTVAGFYLLCIMLASFFFRTWIQRNVSRVIIKTVLQ